MELKKVYENKDIFHTWTEIDTKSLRAPYVERRPEAFNCHEHNIWNDETQNTIYKQNYTREKGHLYYILGRLKDDETLYDTYFDKSGSTVAATPFYTKANLDRLLEPLTLTRSEDERERLIY